MSKLASQGDKTCAAIPAASAAGGTGASGGCYDTAGNRDSFRTTINGIRTTMLDLYRILGQYGYIEDTSAGAAGTFNATMGRDKPTVLPAAAPAGGTGANAGGWDTSANRDTAVTAVNNTRLTLVDLIRILQALYILVPNRDTWTALPAAAPAGGTGATAGGWDTAGNRDSAITTINGLRQAVIDLTRILRDQGIIE